MAGSRSTPRRMAGHRGRQRRQSIIGSAAGQAQAHLQGARIPDRSRMGRQVGVQRVATLWSKTEGNAEGPVNSDTGLRRHRPHRVLRPSLAVNERLRPAVQRSPPPVQVARQLCNSTTCGSVGAHAERAIPAVPITGVRRAAGPYDDRTQATTASSSVAARAGCASPAATAGHASTGLLRAWRVRPHAVDVRPGRQRDLDAAVRQDADLKARLSVYNLLNSSRP